MSTWSLVTACLLNVTHFPSLILLSQQKPVNRTSKTQQQTHLHNWLKTQKSKIWCPFGKAISWFFKVHPISYKWPSFQFPEIPRYQMLSIFKLSHIFSSSFSHVQWKNLPVPESSPVDVNHSVLVYWVIRENLDWRLWCLWFRGSASSSPEGERKRGAPGTTPG